MGAMGMGAAGRGSFGGMSNMVRVPTMAGMMQPHMAMPMCPRVVMPPNTGGVGDMGGMGGMGMMRRAVPGGGVLVPPIRRPPPMPTEGWPLAKHARIE
eukprot:gnl/TRDRNA2_/TRDRNA2_72470_c1_seq1.p2 gnl/TRDRNA2_/TRDRNA2_72470_c1~~gnl/TRDRNA2_/TRDRNA2_72470_c1_seq1.p2  ORF type:complete len:109 (-),score=18.21 gnl/TRDRNA2_/TRDRNA2_72470_c1_seq1:61-354(-)